MFSNDGYTLNDAINEKNFGFVSIFSKLQKDVYADEKVISELFKGQSSDHWTLLSMLNFPPDMDANKLISDEEVIGLLRKKINPVGGLVSARYKWGNLLEKAANLPFVPQFVALTPILLHLKNHPCSSRWESLSKTLLAKTDISET